MLGCDGCSLLFVDLREGGDGDYHLLHGLAVCGDHRCNVIEKPMDGFLDNIAVVVTTDRETMQQMLVAVATLTEINKQQAATIASQQ